MRVAVTGASGFVGGRVVSALARDGHHVLSYGRRPAAALDRPAPNYTVWDLAAGSIEDPNVDAVVHCAAFVGDWGVASRYHDVNVAGTANAIASFRSARRFVHMSSSSVYSDHLVKRDLPEDADTGGCRFSAYGRTKAESERAVVAARPDAIILRPHIVYGPGDATLLPRLIGARRFGRLPIPGDGRNRLSVTHVDNLVDAVGRALSSDTRGAFNVTDGETASADELLRTVLTRAGVKDDIVYLPRTLAWGVAAAMETVWPSGDSPRGPLLTRYIVSHLADDHTLDIRKARALLQYSPRWTFRDGPLFD